MERADTIVTKALTAMRSGQAVLIVTADGNASRRVFGDLAAHKTDGEQTRATNGSQELRAADDTGRIYIRTARPGGLRGLSVDLAIVDLACGPDAYASALAAALARGEVIRYHTG